MSRPGNAFDGEMDREKPMPYKGRGWGKVVDEKKESPPKGVEKKVVSRKKVADKKK